MVVGIVSAIRIAFICNGNRGVPNASCSAYGKCIAPLRAVPTTKIETSGAAADAMAGLRVQISKISFE